LEKQLQVADPESRSIGDDENPEFKLPKMGSLAIVLTTNLLMQVISHLHLTDGSRVDSLRKHQISFFIIVPSSSMYAERLGGGDTFSGLVIGIPMFISALTLVPLLKYDKGAECLDCACSAFSHVI
jgi:hypothetical protein